MSVESQGIYHSIAVVSHLIMGMDRNSCLDTSSTCQASGARSSFTKEMEETITDLKLNNDVKWIAHHSSAKNHLNVALV